MLKMQRGTSEPLYEKYVLKAMGVERLKKVELPVTEPISEEITKDFNEIEQARKERRHIIPDSVIISHNLLCD